MSKVNKLFDIEIDEVSVVDRPANQHGLIAFAKNDGGAAMMEDAMPDLEVFDEAGEAVDASVLEHGDVVFDSEGNEYVFVADEADDEGVEKANWNEVKGAAEAFARKTRRQGLAAASKGRRAARSASASASQKLDRADSALNSSGIRPSYMVGGAALAGAGAGYAAGKVGKEDAMSKSLGDSILEELSKAVSESDREQIIAKAMNEVEIAKAQAAEALDYANAVEDARITDAFISKAAEYNLPVDPAEFGPILKAVAEVLDDEQLELLDELFSAIGDALYNEVGYVGDTSNSSVLDTVNGLASEMVGKADVSYEQAFTAMFEANPSAYDAYIAEGR